MSYLLLETGDEFTLENNSGYVLLESSVEGGGLLLNPGMYGGFKDMRGGF